MVRNGKKDAFGKNTLVHPRTRKEFFFKETDKMLLDYSRKTWNPGSLNNLYLCTNEADLLEVDLQEMVNKSTINVYW